MKFLLILFLGLCFQNNAIAQDALKAEDTLIGETFKGLARAFVAVMDINKLKQHNIEKLNSLEEEKFRKRYVRIYTAVRDLPNGLKSRYGISEDMPKKQAIKDIRLLDKKQIYQIIDALPDSAIANYFYQRIKTAKGQVNTGNIVDQVVRIWNGIVQRMQGG